MENIFYENICILNGHTSAPNNNFYLMTQRINGTLAAISHVYDKSVILIIDMSQFAKTKVPQFVDACGKVKIKFSSLEIDWRVNERNFMESSRLELPQA